MKKLLLTLLCLPMISFGQLIGFGECISGDCENGYGTYTYADGSKYVGEWKDNKMNGQGTVTDTDGSQYVGEWKDDKPHGKGTINLANGDKYVGELKDGKEDGIGKKTYADGRVEEGRFMIGVYIGKE